MGGSAKRLKKDFAKLVRFTACSEIDRKLLSGIFGTAQVGKKSHGHNESIQESRNES